MVREIRYPAGFEQRDQPGLVLAGDGDGTGYGDGEGAALADGVVKDGVDAAQEGAAEGGEAVGDQVAEGIALIDAFYFYCGSHIDELRCI